MPVPVEPTRVHGPQQEGSHPPAQIEANRPEWIGVSARQGVSDFAIDVLATPPLRKILACLEKTRYGRKILNRLGSPRGVFDSFPEAWAAAKRDKHAGHDHPDAVQLHLELAEHLRASDYAALFWLSSIAEEEGALRIFDFGGNAGNLYYSYSPHLVRMLGDIAWTVFDLPVVLEQGRRIAATRPASGLEFTDDPSRASDSNVLLISGAFHYWEGSVAAFLDQFSEPPRHIIVNRTPVHEREQAFFTVQWTDSYAVPCVVRNSRELVSAFGHKGYALIDRWPALELRIRMPFYPSRTVPYYSGFYFVRKWRDRLVNV